MKPQKLIRAAFAIVLIPLGLYLLAALVLARVPANADWREPETGITIFVQSNAFHTGIVLPAGPGKWRAYGWGDRDFYRNTPRWQDIRPATVLSALVGSGSTVVHVDELGDFLPDENWRPLRLRAAEYARLRAYIAGTLRPGPNEPGYTRYDRFFPARGRYSAFNTCNVWTGGALKAAGVRVGLWTPFKGDVMHWIAPPPPEPGPETPRR